jgi:formylglycine-generating enzyme required for sulfatase activity/serine/threonine protein kinase
MDAAPSLHPTDQTLSSYGLGKLDDRSAEAVNEHLMECSDCRKRVAEMSADSFLQRVRDAQKPAGQSTSGQPQPAPTPSDKPANTLMSSSSDSLSPGLATHPDYEVKRELGRGGMGVVYLAHNRMMGRDEVLKVMGQHLMDYPGVLERFLREIRSVARLRHPNIVTAYHASRLGQSVVFAMEYVEGLDLSRLVEIKGPMPVAHACLFIRQAALGLQHAHEKGLVHRDIKPGNLILSREGTTATVKILDFGLAKAAREEKVEDNLTSPGQALGTPTYIAPEQITDAQTADIRADIYSLGGTLYFLLTGRPPFQAKTLYELYQAHISRLADPLNQVRPDVPAELAAVVARMMAKDPAERFQTPGEVAQALKPFCTKANAVLKANVSAAGPAKAGPSTVEAAVAATQLETDADRQSVRPGNAAGSTVARSGWESMVDFQETERKTGAATEVAPRPWNPWVWSSVAVGVLILSVFAAWMGVVFKVKTSDGKGMIVLENVPKDSEILVDGDKITFAWPGVGKPLEIRAVPGQHKVEVKKDGFATFGEVVTVKADDSEEITVRLETGGSGESGFVPLFNGKDLTGWKTHPSQPGNWYLENGVLVGSGSPLSHLYTERDDFSDFHLRVRARTNDHGNGGVCFRAQYEDLSQNEGFPHGFGAQISAARLPFTGSLWVIPGGFFEGGVRESPVAAGQWFTLEIIAEGDRIVVMIDGKITAKLDDGKSRFLRGHIALEQVNAEARVEFSSIEIRELNGTHGPTTPDPAAPKEISNTIGMKLVLIPAGEFLMGSPDSDEEAYSQEKPQHNVRITRPFYLGVHEVTQGQYRVITGEVPSGFEGPNDLPMVNVSWTDAISFCNKLSEREGWKPFYQLGAEVKSGTEGYRLPTEAEWEYACRAGSTAKYSSGDDWDHGNAGRRIRPVGQTQPNAWGLYDMHGNVREWCWDWYDPRYYAQSQAANPLGPPHASDRVNRGGSWDVHPRYCRSAYRDGLPPAYRSIYVGLRVARTVSSR